jgi:ribosomal protein L11 methyltransferase
MSTSIWYVCALETGQADAEMLAEHIRQSWDLEPVLIQKPESEHVWLEIYLETEVAAEQTAAALSEMTAVRAVTTRRCDPRDWQSFWQRHFKPHPIGRRLWITPEWIPAPPDGERVVLQIVPGLSFGTGEHFTTRFCLEMLEELTGRETFSTLWDVGCGSGILAVAGAQLGVQEVVGTDNDPVCLQQAAENAALNGVSDQTRWQVADITVETAGSYQLVCANLFANLLMAVADTLWAATQRYLILSGIREVEVDAVAETFVRLGARERVRDGDGEWAGLLLERGQ